MTKKTTTMLLATTAALTLATAGVTIAQERGPRGGRGGDDSDRLYRAARFLELTEDQKTRLTELREQARAEREQLREATRAVVERLREATASEAPDAMAAGEATIELRRLREQQRAARESFKDTFESLLTPDQLQKWETLQNRNSDGRQGRRRGRRPDRH